jgi:hypothetical protein
VSLGVGAVQRDSHDTLPVDDEGLPPDAVMFRAIRFLCLGNSVFPADFTVSIREKADRDAELSAEFRVPHAAVTMAHRAA